MVDDDYMDNPIDSDGNVMLSIGFDNYRDDDVVRELRILLRYLLKAYEPSMNKISRESSICYKALLNFHHGRTSFMYLGNMIKLRDYISLKIREKLTKEKHGDIE